MNIYKATAYVNGGHTIIAIQAESITDQAVTIARNEHQIKGRQTAKPIVSVRETEYIRYCKTFGEAKDFINSKYLSNIAKIEKQLKDIIKNRQILMTEELA